MSSLSLSAEVLKNTVQTGGSAAVIELIKQVPEAVRDKRQERVERASSALKLIKRKNELDALKEADRLAVIEASRMVIQEAISNVADEIRNAAEEKMEALKSKQGEFILAKKEAIDMEINLKNLTERILQVETREFVEDVKSASAGGKTVRIGTGILGFGLAAAILSRVWGTKNKPRGIRWLFNKIVAAGVGIASALGVNAFIRTHMGSAAAQAIDAAGDGVDSGLKKSPIRETIDNVTEQFNNGYVAEVEKKYENGDYDSNLEYKKDLAIAHIKDGWMIFAVHGTTHMYKSGKLLVFEQLPGVVGELPDLADNPYGIIKAHFEGIVIYGVSFGALQTAFHVMRDGVNKGLWIGAVKTALWEVEVLRAGKAFTIGLVSPDAWDFRIAAVKHIADSKRHYINRFKLFTKLKVADQTALLDMLDEWRYYDNLSRSLDGIKGSKHLQAAIDSRVTAALGGMQKILWSMREQALKNGDNMVEFYKGIENISRKEVANSLRSARKAGDITLYAIKETFKYALGQELDLSELIKNGGSIADILRASGTAADCLKAGHTLENVAIEINRLPFDKRLLNLQSLIKDQALDDLLKVGFEADEIMQAGVEKKLLIKAIEALDDSKLSRQALELLNNAKPAPIDSTVDPIAKSATRPLSALEDVPSKLLSKWDNILKEADLGKRIAAIKTGLKEMSSLDEAIRIAVIVEMIQVKKLPIHEFNRAGIKIEELIKVLNAMPNQAARIEQIKALLNASGPGRKSVVQLFNAGLDLSDIKQAGVGILSVKELENLQKAAQATEVVEPVNEVRSVVQLDSLLKNSKFEDLVQKAGMTMDQVTDSLKNLSGIEAKALHQINDSPRLQKIFLGAMQVEDAAERTAELSRFVTTANKVSKLKIAWNVAGGAADVAGALFCAYDYMENEKKIQATKNLALQSVYETARPVIIADGLVSIGGLVYGTVAAYSAWATTGSVAAALGAGASWVMLPIGLAVAGTKYMHGKLIESVEYHSRTEKELMNMSPGALLNDVTKTANGKQLNIGQMLASWGMDDTFEVANKNSRALRYQAYFARSALIMVPKVQAIDLQYRDGCEYFNKLSPKRKIKQLDLLTKESRRKYVNQCLAYVDKMTNGSYDGVNPDILYRAEQFGLKRYNEYWGSGDIKDFGKWHQEKLASQASLEVHRNETMVHLVLLGTKLDAFESEGLPIVLHMMRHDIADFERKLLASDYYFDSSTNVVRGYIADEIWQIINRILDLKRQENEMLSEGDVNSIFNDIKALFGRSIDSLYDEADKHKDNQFFERLGANNQLLTTHGMQDYFRQYPTQAPKQAGTDSNPLALPALKFYKNHYKDQPLLMGKQGAYFSHTHGYWMRKKGGFSHKKGLRPMPMVKKIGTEGKWQFWQSAEKPKPDQVPDFEIEFKKAA